MQSVPAAELAVLAHLEAVLHGTLIFCCRVIALLALRASQNNIVSHNSPYAGAHDQD